MSRAEGGESARLFVACDLPPELLRALADWQRTELSGHRELRPSASLHLTLAFLGDIERARIPDIERALAAIVWAPIKATLGEPLFLPHGGRKRVLALELVTAGSSLAALQAQVSAALVAAGVYEPEWRAWLPHVTVARFRRPGHPFSLQNVNFVEFGVVRMVLYSSLLERAGAVHTPIAVFPAS